MPARRRSRGGKYGRKAFARRALARIEDAAQDRAKDIAEFIVDHIALHGPYDDRSTSDTRGPHLRDSYYVYPDPEGTGDWMIATRRRYWAFVEFGTAEHGDAQPHVRPAIEAARAWFGD